MSLIKSDLIECFGSFTKVDWSEMDRIRENSLNSGTNKEDESRSEMMLLIIRSEFGKNDIQLPERPDPEDFTRAFTLWVNSNKNRLRQFLGNDAEINRKLIYSISRIRALAAVRLAFAIAYIHSFITKYGTGDV